MTAAEIARGVRAREVSAESVTRDALARIAARDSQLCAFTAVFTERALARAKHVDDALAAGEDPGPLAGVPFAAKNLFDVAGVVTLAGAKVSANDPPAQRDAAAVAALEARGAVLVGVTNMDEFAYGFVTENAHYGTTRNPHAPERIAGGSSGGSAAAVGGALVPLALGSDTNGSIRVPAALCGIFGLRPTFGALSRRGAYPFSHSLDTVGPFARTAADLRATYAALSGDASPGDPKYDERSAARLRIARLAEYFDTSLSVQARSAVARVCDALDAVADVVLPEARRAREAAFVITSAEAGELHAGRLRAHANEFDPATRDRLTAGALVPAAWYVRAQRFRALFRERIAETFARFDVLVAPATPYSAPLAGQRTLTLDGEEIEIRQHLGIFTQPLSLAGVPVVTVPIFASEALPVGVQLVGRAGSEPLLLALAGELERRGVVGCASVSATAAR